MFFPTVLACFGTIRIHYIRLDPDQGKEIKVEPDPGRETEWIRFRIRLNVVDREGPDPDP